MIHQANIAQSQMLNEAAGKISGTQGKSLRFKSLLLLFTSLLAIIILPLTISGQNGPGADDPTLPQTFSTTYPSMSGTVRCVGSFSDSRCATTSTNLQQTINAATYGDTILLQPNTDFVGSFTLPYKPGTGWIVIASASTAFNSNGTIPPGTRVSPANASLMPRIRASSTSAFIFQAQAHHYRLVGLDIGVQSGVTSMTDLVSPHEDSYSSPGNFSNNITIDRCYIHGSDNGNFRRGVVLNGKWWAVIDSYVSNFHDANSDSQALAGWGGEGPIKIVNNYLEAASENINFGGVKPAIYLLTPADIEIRRNYIAKPTSWKGVHAVKNLFESKNARRVLIDGNIFENNWDSTFGGAHQGQDGAAILLKSTGVQGTCSWCVTEHVTFSNNIVRHSTYAVNILAKDEGATNDVNHVKIANVIFSDMGTATSTVFHTNPNDDNSSAGRIFLIQGGPKHIKIDHVTAEGWRKTVDSDSVPSANFTFSNNIIERGCYGISSPITAEGTPTLQSFYQPSLYRKNVLVNTSSNCGNQSVSNAYLEGIYPNPGQTFAASGWTGVGFINYANGNYRLASSSQYKSQGSDAKDIGADMAAIEAASGYTDTATTVLPVAPTSFTISNGNSIGWTDNSNNETGFKIERLISGTYTQIATVGPNVTSYQITVTPCATNEFRVRATNAVGNSAYLNSGYSCTSQSSWNIGSQNKFNFQPSGSTVPTGYLADSGLAYTDRGNGFTYGWDAINDGGLRDRDNPVSLDQRYDTLAAMQYSGDRKWEIAVPNGNYTVHVVAGDPDYYDSQHIYKINVEGVLTVNGVPSSTQRWIEGTQTVTVSDGKLTVSNATGSAYNAICFIDITRVSTPIKINFQPSGSTVPTGYLADSGLAYTDRGNGFTYGWDAINDGGLRDRDNPVSLDQRYDTLAAMQYSGNRTWEIAVPNGSYTVRVVAGDPDYYDSQHIYKINVEGVLTVNGVPSSSQRWIEGTQTVTVSDGKLTVSNATGSAYNAICFIDITPN